jgi:hypothetical protein
LLVAEMRGTRDLVEQMVAQQQQRAGARPDIPPRAFATIALALFGGLDLHRLLDPEEITTDTLDSVLAFFAATARGMGADVHWGQRD